MKILAIEKEIKKSKIEKVLLEQESNGVYELI